MEFKRGMPHDLKLTEEGAISLAFAQLDVVDKGGCSALMQACAHKRATTALVLVDRGAALNFVDGDGKSALDWACEKCSGAVPAAIRARGGRTAAEIRADR
jgi:ankyrin repeat protein